jgi:hypothetical protein
MKHSKEQSPPQTRRNDNSICKKLLISIEISAIVLTTFTLVVSLIVDGNYWPLVIDFVLFLFVCLLEMLFRDSAKYIVTGIISIVVMLIAIACASGFRGEIAKHFPTIEIKFEEWKADVNSRIDILNSDIEAKEAEIELLKEKIDLISHPQPTINIIAVFPDEIKRSLPITYNVQFEFNIYNEILQQLTVYIDPDYPHNIYNRSEDKADLQLNLSKGIQDIEYTSTITYSKPPHIMYVKMVVLGYPEPFVAEYHLNDSEW